MGSVGCSKQLEGAAAAVRLSWAACSVLTPTDSFMIPAHRPPLPSLTRTHLHHQAHPIFSQFSVFTFSISLSLLVRFLLESE